jgi:VWFA-related protein
VRTFVIIYIVSLVASLAAGQSGRVGSYSEITVKKKVAHTRLDERGSEDEIKVDTDLVTIPMRVTTRDMKAIVDLKQSDFRIFEDGFERKVAYFSNTEEPFTVVLLLDMSYSTVFKLGEIQAASKLFVQQLKMNDRVSVIAFDQRPQVLCKPTEDRRALRYAIEATKTGSGTSFYDAVDVALDGELRSITGRKAIVMLSDGVDTSSVRSSAKGILGVAEESDVIIYPIRYDTFDDVRKNRRKDSEIRYDDNDQPYIYERQPEKGEREGDYQEAREFLSTVANVSGGRVFNVSTIENLNRAFAQIAEELRKTYSLGYYPEETRRSGEYTLKVRISRPGLNIRLR